MQYFIKGFVALAFVVVSASPAGAETRRPGSVFRDCDTCPEMVVIPAGSFMMGSPASEAGRVSTEGPRHQVRVKSFAIGKYEVTVGEFAAFVKDSGHDAATSCWLWNGIKLVERSDRSWKNPGFSQTNRHPVTCVSWKDAQAYVSWLSRKTGKRYRLPSEAEWEYATRAGTATARYWGGHLGRNNANCNNCGSRWDGKQTAPVGSFRPNGFGLHDVLGNVWEWVEDCWNSNYGGAPSDGRAWKSGDCGKRVHRGGPWNDGPRFVRSAYRSGIDAGFRNFSNGFRVARGF